MAPIEGSPPKAFLFGGQQTGRGKTLGVHSRRAPPDLGGHLSHLPTTQQQDVMAALETVWPPVANALRPWIAWCRNRRLGEDALNSRLQTMTKSQAEEIGGADTVASMIGGLTPEQQVAILEQFEELCVDRFKNCC